MGELRSNGRIAFFFHKMDESLDTTYNWKKGYKMAMLLTYVFPIEQKCITLISMSTKIL